MLPTLLSSLSPLLKKRDTYYVVLILLLALVYWRLQADLKADEAALAARPKVEIRSETKIETQVKTVRVAGPVQYITKTLYLPNGAREVVRELDRGPSTTTTAAVTDTDRTAVKTVSPACPAALPAPWREADVLIDPTSPAKLVGLGGSVTLWGRLALGAGVRLDRGGEGHAALGVRF